MNYVDLKQFSTVCQDPEAHRLFHSITLVLKHLISGNNTQKRYRNDIVYFVYLFVYYTEI